MLGYVLIDWDDANPWLSALADQLTAEGVRLTGTVQINLDRGADCACDVDLRLLDRPQQLRISQSLGAGSSGCRLDPGALEQAAALVAQSVPDAQLVIVNKFGKQEALGRGMRDVMAQAVGEGVPVLTLVSPDYLPEFSDFAGDFATRLSSDQAIGWCRKAIA